MNNNNVALITTEYISFCGIFFFNKMVFLRVLNNFCLLEKKKKMLCEYKEAIIFYISPNISA